MIISIDHTLAQQMEILSQGWHNEYARQRLCVSKIQRRCGMVIDVKRQQENKHSVKIHQIRNKKNTNK